MVAGGPAWAHLGAAHPEPADVALVRRALAVAPPDIGGDPPGLALPAELPGRRARPAAVLCALWDEPAPAGPAAHVLLTRRSRRLRTHTGEVSFPGGRLEPGEEPLAAALREAHEETGLDPGLVEVVGTLSPVTTPTSGAGITPFVGVLPGRPATAPNPAEVDAVLLVPLAELWAPGVHREERWPVAGGGSHAVTFFELVGDTVWGATARMLRELLDRLHAAPPSPGDHR